MGTFALWLLCPILGAAILSRHNKAGTGFLLGAILGPIGLLFAIVIRSNENKKEEDKKHQELLSVLEESQVNPANDKPERECPFCAETILKKAKLCKHCGKELEPAEA